MCLVVVLAATLCCAKGIPREQTGVDAPTLSSKTWSTTAFNAYATPAANRINNKYSNDALLALWEQVGPVAPPKHTITVQSTAEASLFARPGKFHPLVASHDQSLKNKKLPSGFMWGVASSAYQIEGAVKEDGKGPSIWDLLAHRVPGWVKDNSTGDIVAEHYYLYKQDFARMKALGIKAFDFSISWPRIFPFGKGPVNEAGVKHYDEVVAEAIKNGVTPVITLFHWGVWFAFDLGTC
jgi:hypothetical protein